MELPAEFVSGLLQAPVDHTSLWRPRVLAPDRVDYSPSATPATTTYKTTGNQSSNRETLEGDLSGKRTLITKAEENMALMTVSNDLIAGRYALLTRVGEGKLSSVFKAEDRRRHNQIVAVKLLDTDHPEEFQRVLFHRETQALQRLNHPNIVRIHDYGWEDSWGCFYIVLEFLPRTLQQEISSHPDPSENEWCWPIMRQIADALVHAHSEGVLHRDIKPSNILLDEAGTPKLSDFGISLLKYELATGLTVSSFWSAGYASPERRKEGPGDERSDIFSLGALYYHLLSRKSPPADGPSSQMVEQLAVPPPVRRIIKRMLAPAPEDRPADATIVCRALAGTRALERIPEILLVVTDAAQKHLFDLGMIDVSSAEHATDWLIEELGGQEMKPVPTTIDKNGVVTLLGDQVRVKCVRDKGGAPALAITAIQMAYGPNIEAHRSAATPICALWQPISKSQLYKLNDAEERLSDLDNLFDALATNEQEQAVGKERRAERREFVTLWDKVLDYQARILTASATCVHYEYFAEDGDLITFRLTEPAPDSLGWVDGTPIEVVDGQDKPGHPIGSLISVSGRTVLVNKITTRGLKGRSLPRSGELRRCRIEEIAALKRQRDALSLLKAGGTVNPRLSEVLTDLSRAEFDDPDVSMEFVQQDLADDKRDAVRQALAAHDIFLLQGPPGTGKTTAIAEMVLQILKAKPDARLLISSQSNVAVNHVLSRVTSLPSGQRLEIVRLGRTEKIGHGAEPWTLDQRLESWREEVVGRCESVQKELLAESRRLRKKEAERLSPELLSTLEQCRDWIDEASAWIDALREDEDRYKAVSDVLTSPNARRDGLEGSSELEAEAQLLEESIISQRARIAEHLETVRGFLPPEVQGMVADDAVQEMNRLRSAVAQVLDPGDADDPAKAKRSLIKDWCEVFGRTDDCKSLLLARANILAATCLYSGGRWLRNAEFDWAIVDEAGRATAPELLVPIVRSRRVILVGDERQLPPLLDEELSPKRLAEANITSEDLEKSLFEELITEAKSTRPETIRMLTVQHRMHPAIGRLISHVFYEKQLRDGVAEADREHSLEWIPKPVMWLSTARLPSRYEIHRGVSFANSTEADVVDDLLRRMEQSYRTDPSFVQQGKRKEVGVIAAYSAQIEDLQARLNPQDTIAWQALDIEVATVDGFQGRDRDIVIYSTVRSNPEKRIGFLRDRRRVNVALSRARRLLVIVGDVVTLEGGVGGLGANPFRDVFEYMRTHPEDCRIQTLGEDQP